MRIKAGQLRESELAAWTRPQSRDRMAFVPVLHLDQKIMHMDHLYGELAIQVVQS